MSDTSQQPTNVVDIGVSEADRLLNNLRKLREELINAWFERGVMLTPDEQVRLRDEIRQTCALLSDLTASA
jgi:hypothetical protein